MKPLITSLSIMALSLFGCGNYTYGGIVFINTDKVILSTMASTDFACKIHLLYRTYILHADELLKDKNNNPIECDNVRFDIDDKVVWRENKGWVN